MFSNIKLLDGGFGQAIINKGLEQIGTLWGCSAYLNEQDHQKVIDTHLDFINAGSKIITCLLYTSPSPRDLSTSRMPSSA